jgi:hypothetical protein
MSTVLGGMSYYFTSCHIISLSNPPEIFIFKIIGYPVLLAGQEKHHPRHFAYFPIADTAGNLMRPKIVQYVRTIIGSIH